MKATSVVRRQIEKQGPDSIWSLADFPNLSMQAVSQALSRLARAGVLLRVRKGIYYFPKQTILGPSRPNASAVLEKAFPKSKFGSLYTGGTASFQNLGITSQIPAEYVLLSDQPARKLQIGKSVVRIRQRSLAHLDGATEQDVWLLDAIRNLKHAPDVSPNDAIEKIIYKLSLASKTLKRLLRFTLGEPPRVRAVMGAIADHLGYQGREIELVKRSLNPLTRYKLGIASTLPTASTWNIV
jgi:Family of unknown function (DUF6088)